MSIRRVLFRLTVEFAADLVLDVVEWVAFRLAAWGAR